ncbi:MAG: hypothetical protein COU08_03365 [Candidatus Harrisonbacteria bacterium CG10_big_fil_rev_8_21_14_0_10_42_17]|uniref:Uncharacterized protein n=1 Tax=Candidatus Harrisonbacteria bacterium CG10_big_fil_rev_8_21_14_0_10_42_17 TaxID=1974584 RepID=A0A2M6WHP8_9BACT|nr:MAG: hypothetical protein COU08_03365 [Candidatus Harrisonbacteria bacterium CG10_big_fil_rev_8_21_14_0_10_42_17]
MLITCQNCKYPEHQTHARFCNQCGAPLALPSEEPEGFFTPSLVGYPVGLALYRLEFLPVGAEFSSREEAFRAACTWGSREEHKNPVVTQCDSSVPEETFPMICENCKGFVEKKGVLRPCRGCRSTEWIPRSGLPAEITTG